ncbi:unnamed protein product [Alternaria alternata]
MSMRTSSDQGDGGPSVLERIKALHDHSELFTMIAEFPQAGIHNTFPEEWALAIAYAESEVYRCRRALGCFQRKNIQSKESNPSGDEYKSVMDDLINAMLLLGRIVEASQKMSSSTPPSKKSMDRYRIFSHVEKSGMRGANGEMAFMYGQMGESIPFNLATVDDEDLQPMARFISKWLLDPLVEYILAPPRDLLLKLPMYKTKYSVESKESRRRIFNTKTVSAVAETCVYTLAILILIAPIATFTVVEEQSLRIIIMPLFCLVLVVSAQLMGSDAMPLYTLVVA